MVHGAWCMVHGAWCMVHGAGGGAGAIWLEPFTLNSWNGFTLRERCVLNPIGTINFNSY